MILAIQGVWHEEAGEAHAHLSEAVMHKSHGLLAAASLGSLEPELAGASIIEYIGSEWVATHPQVLAAIQALDRASRGDA